MTVTVQYLHRRKQRKGAGSATAQQELKNMSNPLVTHTYPLASIDEAYELFENKRDGVIKVAVEC